MSLVEAAAALDRLLRGNHQEGAPPNAPLSAHLSSSLEDDGNLLPALFPNIQPSLVSSTPCRSMAAVSSTPLPWKHLTPCPPEEVPVTPFNRSFSPLPSPVPIPLPSPTLLQALPSPMYPPHWAVSLEEFPSEEENQLPPEEANQLSPIEEAFKTLDDCVFASPPKTDSDLWRRRRRRRRFQRTLSEGAPPLEGEEEENFVPLDPEKYKTELCRSFQVHDSCRCNYAHGLTELRRASRHGKYKTRNCHSYHQTGFCRYGARCSFIHDPEEGILKCSIVNKEVLEALHYRPAEENPSRTANITWRLLETSGESIPELHFISSSTGSSDLIDTFSALDPQKGNINVLIGPGEGFDNTSVFTCALPFQVNDDEIFPSTLLRQDNLDLIRSLQKKENSKETDDLKEPGEGSSCLSVFDSAIFSGIQYRVPLYSSDHQSSTEDAAIKAFFPEDKTPLETVVKSTEERIVQSMCQELKDLDIVQSIMQKYPGYSSSVWSDGTDIHGVKAKVDVATQPLDDHNGLKESSASYARGFDKNNCAQEKRDLSSYRRKIRNASRRKRRGGKKNIKEDLENYKVSGIQMKDFHNENGTLTDPEAEKEELEVLTGVAGANGDDWSEKSSLHLADLLRSLRLREGSNKLLPWSKPGRKYSSDGSSTGPSSAIDLRSSQSSPVSPRQHDMSKYKTELCRSFQYNGYCSYGDACLYAHGQLDLRSYPKHPMYRTKACFSFHNKGFCLYGSRCQFLHDLE